MKSFDSRTYSINDFVEWDSLGQVELNPAFQRRAVWTEKAKSYLMDTIARGKPIPKIFIRQKINTTTRTSIREVVDGQQRLRTILNYVKDGFTISRQHNRDLGGLRFSQLPEDAQTQILSYELAVDLLINLPDSEILDIFGRLNSYAIVLNEQEKINADHFSAFKILADEIGRKYTEYWTKQGILTSKAILRMAEVQLVSDLLIAMREGIKSKKQIKRYYDSYEKHYDDDPEEVEYRFDEVINTIHRIYAEGLSNTEFKRPHVFYSLFTAVAHSLHGLKGLTAERIDLRENANFAAQRNRLDRVQEIFAEEDPSLLTADERQFLLDCRAATTDEAVRIRRTEYLLGLMV